VQQNVVERPVSDPADKGWKDTVVKAYDTPSKIAMLPFFLQQRDGSTIRKLAKCRVVRADHRTTEQMHFYLETNAVIAEPSNAGIVIYASTQSPSDCQSSVATLLKTTINHVDVQVKQLGGGYGGKTVRSKYHAVAAGLVCRLTGKSAKLIISREDDSAMTGRRHPYFLRVYLAILVDDAPEFKSQDLKGTIAAYYMQAWIDNGFYYDAAETILNVAVEDSDGCYYSALSRAEGQMLLTNKIANTAMRTFGHASIMALENAIEAAGHCKDIYPNDGDGNSTSIRIRSIYTLNEKTPIDSVLTDNILPQLFFSMRDSDWYTNSVKGVRDFNKNNRWRKRGQCLQPAKYKIGFEFGTLEQGHAVVNVFKGDGSVLVMHDGVEIGQGLSTKAIQIAATELGIPINLVQIGTTGAKVTPNPTSTGASSGSEIKGGATREACKILKKRLSDWCMAWYAKNAELASQEKPVLDKNWQKLDFWNYKNGSF
jgi:xanthine dehydrogenase/oxidase